MKINLLVLAAGQGIRMKSNKPKWMATLLNESLIQYIADDVKELNISNYYICISKNHCDYVDKIPSFFKVVYQNMLYNGSAGPLFSMRDYLNENERLIIVPCDIPLIDFKHIYEEAQNNNNDIIFYSKIKDNKSYGSIVERKKELKFIDNKKRKKKIDLGIYVINERDILTYLITLNKDEKSNEYQLSDLVSNIAKEEKVICSFIEFDYNYIDINTEKDLDAVEYRLRYDILHYLEANDVKIMDKETTWIGNKVKFGNQVIVYPNNHIYGDSFIGSNSLVFPGNFIIDSVIGEENVLNQTYISNSKIKDKNNIGPYTSISENSVIDCNISIGNFVEIKRSNIGESTKIMQHAYIGDTSIGRKCNIGSGTITSNNDVGNKNKIIIGDNVFIGSNVTLIAPLNINSNSHITDGNTLSRNTISNKCNTSKSEYIEKEFEE